VTDPLKHLAGRITAGTLLLSAAGAFTLAALGQGRAGVGLFAGALVSALNFLATSRFIGQARDTVRRTGEGLPGARAALGFILRYLVMGLTLVILILGLGLPAAATIFGVAVVPLTIYLWQMGLLLTGRWRRPGM
jgi:hypothetical protein